MRKKGRQGGRGGESCWGSRVSGGQECPLSTMRAINKKRSRASLGRTAGAEKVRCARQAGSWVETNISRKADGYELWLELTTRCVLLRMNRRTGTQPTARSTWRLQRAPDGSTE